MGVSISKDSYFSVQATRRKDGLPPKTKEDRLAMRETYKKIKAAGRIRFRTEAEVEKRIKQLIKTGVVEEGQIECSGETWNLSF
tara:strand:+ start:2569 stop:2820 length:252 start_codon:yes stop_codon:yes gene_type:complete